MEQRKTFSEILTHGYLLAIRDEIDFKERFTLRVSLAKALLGLFVLGILSISFSLLLIKTNPFSRSNSENEAKEVIRLMQKTDSLEMIIAQQGRYHVNLQQILKGETPEDQAPQAAKPLEGETENYLNKASEVHPLDSQFREGFENQGASDLMKTPLRGNDLKQLVFFPPLKGITSQAFDVKKGHYGIDIVAEKNTPIKAAADGSVILSSWTQDSGHVIAVQHKNQVITFYKHNSVLLKKVGDYVRAGEAIAVIGNSGEQTNGPHLHLEVWYDGNPVNPADFIAF